MILKYRKFIEECESGLHQSNFSIKLLRLHNLKTRLNNAVSEWNNATVDFCLALDNENEICPPLLRSHISIVSQEADIIFLMLDSYIDEYFKLGIDIEEKLNSGQTVTKEEYRSFQKINKHNPFAEKPMANAESLLKTKCYIDVLSSLIKTEGYGIIDEVNALLFLIAQEFNISFKQNPNSYDKIYLKYTLVVNDEDGLSHTLYDPVEARRLRKSYLSRGKRLLPESKDEESNLLN